MSVSIMEALQNANHNIDNLKTMPMLLPLVKEQLNNAATLLEKGYSIWDEVEPLLEKYGDVENVPEKGRELISSVPQANALYEEIGMWSKNTFPDANSIDHLQKLKDEAQEAKEAPSKIEEYADCIIALLAGAWKADIAFFELIEAVEDKLKVNKQRKWQKLPNGTYQHLPNKQT